MPSSSPPELRRIQEGLHRIFTDPRGARAAAAERPAVASWIREAPPIDRETRLSVYGDAYFLRLLDALSSNHSAVRRALGEHDFRVLAAEYFAAHPPTSRSLADLGDLFPDFAAKHRFARQWPFLGDLARLERTALTALLTDRLARLAPADLSALGADDWNGARLGFDPTVRVLELEWPVAELWRRRDEPLEAPGRTLRRARAQRLVVWRDDVWVRVRELTAVEAAVLKGAVDGLPLASVFGLLNESTSPSRVQRWFAAWINDGLVKKVLAPEQSAAVRGSRPRQA